MKVAYELSGPSARVRAPQMVNDSSSPPQDFYKNVFIIGVVIEIYYRVIEKCLIRFSKLYQ